LPGSLSGIHVVCLAQGVLIGIYADLSSMSMFRKTASAPVGFFLRFDSADLKHYRATFHVIFWGCYLIYQSLIWGMVDGKYAERFSFTLVELPIIIGATYFTLYLLIDRLLFHRRYALFLVTLTLSMIAFGLLLRTVSYYTMYPIFYPAGLTVPVLYLPKILIGIFTIYSIVGIVSAFHVVKHWHNHQQASQQLQQEKLESELKVLKSQINPHFLFNTLNSLYVLSMNGSKSTPDVVHKLSELMSYMLYESNQDEVLLKEELNYIENYIALEKIRYEARVDISFNVYSNIDSFHIAPLLILPFVENCFKHGVRNQRDIAWIRIDIILNDSVLTAKIENSKNIEDGTVQTISGIGLQNVKKRLDLIYPNRFQLQLINDHESYLVVLKLELDKNKVLAASTVDVKESKSHELHYSRG
jgi:two-component system, LytTR family, sensor kinase